MLSDSLVMLGGRGGTQGKKRRLSCKVLERMLQRISAGIYTLVVVLQVVHLNES